MNELIPKGLYCYTRMGVKHPQGGMTIKSCPFWRSLPNRHRQENGYCLHNHSGDFGERLGLLWDMVKECDINYDYPEIEEIE